MPSGIHPSERKTHKEAPMPHGHWGFPQNRKRRNAVWLCGHMKTKTCPDCNGDGVVDKDTDNERQCPTCGGLGFVPDDDDGHEEVIKTQRSCERVLL
jgi:DnaJ-class molecular chaperone